LFAQGMTRASVCIIFAIAPVIAAILIASLPKQSAA